MAYEMLALLTNVAKTYYMEQSLNGKSFKVDHFVVGRYGHDLTDPKQALTPRPEMTLDIYNEELGKVYGPTDLTGQYDVDDAPFCKEYVCTLPRSTLVSEISSIGLVATVVYVPPSGTGALGDQFLYAYTNFPLKVKTDLDLMVFNLQVQY